MSRPSHRLLSWGIRCLQAGALAQGGAMAEAPLHIEVFTTQTQPITVGVVATHPGVALQISEVDAVERFDSALSEGLPIDPALAQREVQRRLATFNDRDGATLRRSATGLATAARLGIDRTPAIVFDQSAVIYGVTDLPLALRHYQAWAAKAR